MGRKTKKKQQQKREAIMKHFLEIFTFIEESLKQKAQMTELIAIMRKKNDELKKQLPRDELERLEKALAADTSKEDNKGCQLPQFITDLLTNSKDCECFKSLDVRKEMENFLRELVDIL